MPHLTSIVFVSALLSFPGARVHAEETDILYIPFQWNPVGHSKNLVDVAGDCLRRSVVCAMAVETASTYFIGIIPGTWVLGATAMEEWGLNPYYREEGEEYSFSLSIPDAYRICDIGVQDMSAAPSRGKYSPTFSVAVQSNNRVDVYSFVHRMPILVGAGARSWIDTKILLQAARIGSEAERACYFDSGSKYSHTCKGSEGTNNGLQACTNITFGGIELTPPVEPFETDKDFLKRDLVCGTVGNPPCH